MPSPLFYPYFNPLFKPLFDPISIFILPTGPMQTVDLLVDWEDISNE